MSLSRSLARSLARSYYISKWLQAFRGYFLQIKYFLMSYDPLISYTMTLDGYGNTFGQITVPRSPGPAICTLRNVSRSPTMCQTLEIQNYNSQSLSPGVLQSPSV